MRGITQHLAARSRTWWRLLWALVLLAHAPATLSVCAAVLRHDTSDEEWRRLVLLSASNLFFLVEILAAPCIRVLSNRRAAVIFLLAVAILHVGVLEPATPDLICLRDASLWINLSAAGMAALCLLLLPRVLKGLFATPFVATGPPSDRRRTRLSPILQSLTPLSAWLRAPLRAPPALR